MKDLNILNNKKVEYAFLALITLIALILRFYKLGDWSFWGDEIFTLRNAQAVFDPGFFNKSLTNLLIRFAIDGFGISEWSTRLIPALIGAISIPVLYIPIRKIFGTVTALISVLLLALSPWHIYWSQNARVYTAMLLFYTLALLAFYWALEKNRPVYMLASLLFLGLGSLERFTVLMLVPVIIGYLILLKLFPVEKPVGFQLNTLLPFFLPLTIGGAAFTYLYLPRLVNFNDGWVNNSPFWILSGVAFYVGIPTICLGSFAAFYLLHKRDRSGLFLTVTAFVPLITIMVLSLFTFTANRYIFISLTSWLILAAVAIKLLMDHLVGDGKIIGIGVIAILLLTPFSEDILYYQYQNGNRDNWRAAFDLINRNKQEGDLILVPNNLLGDYYTKTKTIGMANARADELVSTNQRVWVVEDLTVEQKWPNLRKWVLDNADLQGEFDVRVQARNYKMRVYLYDPYNISSLSLEQ